MYMLLNSKQLFTSNKINFRKNKTLNTKYALIKVYNIYEHGNYI